MIVDLEVEVTKFFAQFSRKYSFCAKHYIFKQIDHLKLQHRIKQLKVYLKINIKKYDYATPNLVIKTSNLGTQINKMEIRNREPW